LDDLDSRSQANRTEINRLARAARDYDQRIEAVRGEVDAARTAGRAQLDEAIKKLATDGLAWQSRGLLLTGVGLVIFRNPVMTR
jgi:hypothetical protein